MKHLKLLTLGACLLFLPACQQVDDVLGELGADEPFFSELETPRSENLIQGGPCPQVKVVDELSALSEFTNMQYPAPGELISRVHVGQVESACEYGPKSVTVDLKLAFEGMLGPHGRVNNSDKPFFSYPFFVAVTSPGGDILAKEVFAASMTYKPGQDRQTYYESLRQIIPVPSEVKGARYQVLVGFQLSEEQLGYNRMMIRQLGQARRNERPRIVTTAAPTPAASSTTTVVTDGPVVITP